MAAQSIRPIGFTGRYQEVVWNQGNGVSVTAHLWGGGGGGGANGWLGAQGYRGSLRSSQGGAGCGGGYSRKTFTVNNGDVISIAVGGGGGRGINTGQGSGGGAWGGTGGTSYTDDTFFNLRTATPITDPNIWPFYNPPVRDIFNRYWGNWLRENAVWADYNTPNYSGVLPDNWYNGYYVTFPVSGNYTFGYGGGQRVSLDVSLWYSKFQGYKLHIIPGNAPRNDDNYNYVTTYIDAGTYILSANGSGYGFAGSPGVGLTIYGTGYNGGTGGRAGAEYVTGNYPGSGGGGGGATVLFLNGTVIAGAGGGGGGGGGRPPGFYEDYAPGQSAPGDGGQSGESTIGQDGATAFDYYSGTVYGSIGGGGGGGGGVSLGGNGGSIPFNPTMNNTAGAGMYGSSTGDVTLIPTNRTPGGTDNPYYLAGVGTGGVGGINNTALEGSGNSATAGGNGYAALVFDLAGINVNNGTSFQPVSKTWIKMNDSWTPVQSVWINDNGTWKELRGGTPPLFTSLPTNFGASQRAFPYIPPDPMGSPPPVIF